MATSLIGGGLNYGILVGIIWRVGYWSLIETTVDLADSGFCYLKGDLTDSEANCLCSKDGTFSIVGRFSLK